MQNIVKAKRLLSTKMIDTYTIKATAIVKETEKAFLFRTLEGDCWIPFSCVRSVDLYPGKKRPYRVQVIKSFEVKYLEISSKTFLNNLNKKTDE